MQEANALLPRLSMLVGEQMVRASEVERRLRALRAAGKGGRLLEAIAQADEGALDIEERALREQLIAYESGWRAVESLGIAVKDPRIGLCDFQGRVDGKLVWLCWRYGERAVEYYHALDAGFARRKPLAGLPPRPRVLN